MIRRLYCERWDCEACAAFKCNLVVVSTTQTYKRLGHVPSRGVRGYHPRFFGQAVPTGTNILSSIVSPIMGSSAGTLR